MKLKAIIAYMKAIGVALTAEQERSVAENLGEQVAETEPTQTAAIAEAVKSSTAELSAKLATLEKELVDQKAENERLKSANEERTANENKTKIDTKIEQLKRDLIIPRDNPEKEKEYRDMLEANYDAAVKFIDANAKPAANVKPNGGKQEEGKDGNENQPRNGLESAVDPKIMEYVKGTAVENN